VSEPVQALVVVDMQRGLLAGPDAVVGGAALTARVEDLIGRATAAGALVVQLQNDGAPGQVDEPGRPGWELALTGGTVLRKAPDDRRCMTRTSWACAVAAAGVAGIVGAAAAGSDKARWTAPERRSPWPSVSSA